MKKECCPQCGQSIMRHKHSMSRSLVHILIKAYQCEKYVFHLQNDLNLSKSEYANFQKLKYWGLVKKDDDNLGYWEITSAGFDFLENKIPVFRFVWTYNNKVVDTSDDKVLLSDLKFEDFGFKKRNEYSDDAVPEFSVRYDLF